MTRWAPVLVVLILIVLLGSLAQDQSPSSAPGKPLETPLVKRWDGITIIYNAEDPWSVFESDLQIATQWGSPCIQVQVSYFSRDHASAAFPVFDRRSPTPVQLRQICKAVKSLGKTLVLHPVLLIQDPQSPYWRGQFSPFDDAQWWSDYTHWIEKLAIAAQASQVDLLFIGSELTSLQAESSRWASVIQTVRRSLAVRSLTQQIGTHGTRSPSIRSWTFWHSMDISHWIGPKRTTSSPSHPRRAVPDCCPIGPP